MPPEMRSSPVSSVTYACAGRAASAAIVRAEMAPQPVILMELTSCLSGAATPAAWCRERERDRKETDCRRLERPQGRPPSLATPPAMADDEPGGRSPGSRVIDFVPSSRDASPEGPAQPVTYWNGASPLTVAVAARESAPIRPHPVPSFLLKRPLGAPGTIVCRAS